MNRQLHITLLLAGTLVLAVPHAVLGAEESLSQPDFTEKCRQEHFTYTSNIPLPGNSSGFTSDDYEAHYKKIMRSPKADAIEKCTFGPGYRSLRTGRLYMDLPDGYNLSCEYRIEGEENLEIISGGDISAYYTASPVENPKSPGEQFTYMPNSPENVHVVYDLPQNYPWQSHDEDALKVTQITTVHSADGQTDCWEQSCFITNLNTAEPDCYYLLPTDLKPYVVKPGDTLRKIADAHYASESCWQIIFHRNQTQIKNPDLIYPGQLLVLPDKEAWN